MGYVSMRGVKQSARERVMHIARLALQDTYKFLQSTVCSQPVATYTMKL